MTFSHNEHMHQYIITYAQGHWGKVQHRSFEHRIDAMKQYALMEAEPDIYNIAMSKMEPMRYKIRERWNDEPTEWEVENIADM